MGPVLGIVIRAIAVPLVLTAYRLDQGRCLLIGLVRLHRFYPLVQAVVRHAQTLGNFGHSVTAIDDLSNRFVLN